MARLSVLLLLRGVDSVAFFFPLLPLGAKEARGLPLLPLPLTLPSLSVEAKPSAWRVERRAGVLLVSFALRVVLVAL